MTHEQQRQLMAVLRPIKAELDAGRLFEAQQIARWAGPNAVLVQQRAQAHAARMRAAIDTEMQRVKGMA